MLIRKAAAPLILIGLGVLYAFQVSWLIAHRQPESNDYHPEVVLPAAIQQVLMTGDQYLAANFNTYRTLIASTKKPGEQELIALTELHLQASHFNPGHEDNYYVASAMLPWRGKVEPAQTILRAAADARPHDFYPLFFWGFNAQYFLHDYLPAAAALREAAERAEGGDRQGLTYMAARWQEKHEDLPMNIRIVRAMIDHSRDRALKDALRQRLVRLEGLHVLREAYVSYEHRYGKPPEKLLDLINGGVIRAIPDDPLKGGYIIDRQQRIRLLPAQQ